jgi:hypothetical protein
MRQVMAPSRRSGLDRLTGPEWRIVRVRRIRRLSVVRHWPPRERPTRRPRLAAEPAGGAERESAGVLDSEVGRNLPADRTRWICMVDRADSGAIGGLRRHERPPLRVLTKTRAAQWQLLCRVCCASAVGPAGSLAAPGGRVTPAEHEVAVARDSVLKLPRGLPRPSPLEDGSREPAGRVPFARHEPWIPVCVFRPEAAFPIRHPRPSLRAPLPAGSHPVPFPSL